MQTKKNKWWLVVVIIALLFMVGLLRDQLFVRMNYQIQALQNGGDPYPYTGIFSFIHTHSVSALLTYKWAFTFVFFAFHWAITCSIVYFFFRHTKNFLLTHLVYGAILALSLLVYVLVGIIPWGATANESAYHFARTLMGAGQSPVLVMITVLVCYLRKV